MSAGKRVLICAADLYILLNEIIILITGRSLQCLLWVGSCHTRALGNPRRRHTSALSACASADSSLLSLAGQKI